MESLPQEDRTAEIERDKAAVDKIVELQTKIITSTYDKATAYTNIIILAGYAMFFGLWTLTKPYLSKPAALWAAVFMLVSATSFIAFEIYKMVSHATVMVEQFRSLSDRIRNKTVLEIQAEFERLQLEGQRVSARLLKAWVVCLGTAVPAALIAVAILLVAFVRGLITDAA